MHSVLNILYKRNIDPTIKVNVNILNTFKSAVTKFNNKTKEEFALHWISYCLNSKLQNQSSQDIIHNLFRNRNRIGSKVFTRTGTQLLALGFIYWKGQDAFNKAGLFDTVQFKKWLFNKEKITISNNDILNLSDLIKHFSDDYLNNIFIQDGEVILNSSKVVKFDFFELHQGVTRSNDLLDSNLYNDVAKQGVVSQLQHIINEKFSYSNLENRTIHQSKDSYPIVSVNKTIPKEILKFDANTILQMLREFKNSSYNLDSTHQTRKFKKNGFKILIEKNNDNTLSVLIMCSQNKSFAKNVPDVDNGTYKSIHRNNLLFIIKDGIATEVKHVVTMKKFDNLRYGHEEVRGEKKFLGEKNLGFYVNDNGNSGIVTRKVSVMKSENMGEVARTGANFLPEAELRNHLGSKSDEYILQIFEIGLKNATGISTEKIEENNLEVVNKYLSENRLKNLEEYRKINTITTNKNQLRQEMISIIVKNKSMAFLISGEFTERVLMASEEKNQSSENSQNILNEGFKIINDQFSLEKANTLFMSLDETDQLKALIPLSSLLSKYVSVLSKYKVDSDSYNKKESESSALKSKLLALKAKSPDLENGILLLDTELSALEAESLAINTQLLALKARSSILKTELLELITSIINVGDIKDKGIDEQVIEHLRQLKGSVEEERKYFLSVALNKIQEIILNLIKEIYYKNIFNDKGSVSFTNLKRACRSYPKLFTIKDDNSNGTSYSKAQIIKLMQDPRDNISKKVFYNEYGGQDLSKVLEKHQVLKLNDKAKVAKAFIGQLTTSFKEVAIPIGSDKKINIFSSYSASNKKKLDEDFLKSPDTYFNGSLYFNSYSPIFDIKTKNMLLDKTENKDFTVKIIDFTEFEHTFYYGGGKIKCNEILQHVKNVIAQNSKDKNLDPFLLFIETNEMNGNGKVTFQPGRLYKNIEILSAIKLQQNFEIIRTIIDIMLPNTINYDNYKDNRWFFIRWFSGANKDTLNGIKLQGKFSKLDNEINNLINDLSLDNNKLNNFIEKISKFK